MSTVEVNNIIAGKVVAQIGALVMELSLQNLLLKETHIHKHRGNYLHQWRRTTDEKDLHWSAIPVLLFQI